VITKLIVATSRFKGENMRVKSIAFFVCALIMLSASASMAAVTVSTLCVKPSSDQTYRLDVGIAGDAIIVNGVRYSTPNVPIAGSAFIKTDGTVVISFTSHFNWGSGSWVNPLGTATLTIGPGGGSLNYDITYFGATTTPYNYMGTFTVVTCPSSTEAAPSSDDPNLKR
jgi:hypothetical protein